MVPVGVVGATGLVGETMMKVLQDRSFPMDSFHPFASDRSEGTIVRCMGSDYPVEIITPGSISKGMILFGATSSKVAEKWVPMCIGLGAVIVDNSSAYRMDPEVPLVVPEVNGDIIRGTESLIANPNCSTIQLVVALGPLRELGSIQWISVSTYQAVSGAGTPGLRELEEQQAGKLPRSPAHRIHENVRTSIGPQVSGGFCGEEIKLMKETCKILNSDFPVYSSTARVPVRTGHTEAVTVKFDREVSVQAATELLQKAPGVRVASSGTTPIEVENTDDVVVERMRVNPADPETLQFWVLADNLRNGAALNAVQIAETYIRGRSC